MTIAEQLRAAREAAGLTQEQLANRMGFAAPRISEYEAGKVDPSATRFLAILASCQASRTTGPEPAPSPDAQPQPESPQT